MLVSMAYAVTRLNTEAFPSVALPPPNPRVRQMWGRLGVSSQSSSQTCLPQEPGADMHFISTPQL